MIGAFFVAGVRQLANYIYALHCPLAGTVRYVGKSSNPQKRLKSHLSSAKTFSYRHHTSAWIRKLLSVGLEPRMEILEEVPEGTRWQDSERNWISSAADRGWRLTNSTSGGEGLDYICPEAAASYRANLSTAMTELWNRPERKEEARLRSLAAWADPEITARRKASQELARSRPETQARFVAAAKEIHSRPEVKEKLSASLKAAWADPERKAAWVAATTTPEVKRRQSEAKKQLWASAEGREKMLALFTPERRARQAELAKDPVRQAKVDAARNSPEYKAKRAATIRAKWIDKNKHLPPEEFARKLAHNDRVTAKRQAAKLAESNS